MTVLRTYRYTFGEICFNNHIVPGVQKNGCYCFRSLMMKNSKVKMYTLLCCQINGKTCDVGYWHKHSLGHPQQALEKALNVGPLPADHLGQAQGPPNGGG